MANVLGLKKDLAALFSAHALKKSTLEKMSSIAHGHGFCVETALHIEDILLEVVGAWVTPETGCQCKIDGLHNAAGGDQ